MTRHIPTKIPGISDLIKQLLSTPSVSCTSKDIDQGNLHVIQLLADWFESLGFDCNIQIVDQDADKANLIATLGSGNNGLVLAGHTDTVEASDSTLISTRKSTIYIQWRV